MANGAYQTYLDNMLGDGVRVDLDDDSIVARLVSDDDYIFDPAGTVGTVAAIPPYNGIPDVTLQTPVISNQAFDADDAVFNLVSPDGVKTVQGVVVLKDTGAGSFFPLWYYDLASPVTPNGTNITVEWNVAGLISVASA